MNVSVNVRLYTGHHEAEHRHRALSIFIKQEEIHTFRMAGWLPGNLNVVN